jgi:glycosyltransferase involved in cell wall biosynthesis
MKLLFVVNTFEYFVSHRLALATAAVHLGWQVHVASPKSLTGVSLSASGITHHPIALERREGDPLRELRAIAQLGKVYSKIKPDMVHAIGPKAVMYGGLLARLCRVKALVCLVPGLGYAFVAEGTRGILLRFVSLSGYRIGLSHPNKRVIFQNPEDKEFFLQRKLCTLREARLVLGSGVDTSLWPPTDEPPGVPIVLYASRFLKEKGIEVFVEAARQLIAQGTNARFVLAGQIDPGNPSSASLEQIDLWIRNGIENWGFKQDMAEVFQASTIVCLPTYRREGIPKVLIEASASQRPVITTDAPGCREIVKHRVTGLLIPPRDPAALRNAIEHLLENPALRRSMGTAGRSRVESAFALGQVVAQTMDIYRELLATSNPR